MARRARPAVALLLPLALLLFGAPTAIAADCPDLLPKNVYEMGETLSFFGNYSDFADPGSVTIVFTRSPDGLTRTYHAFNNPDGAWLRDVAFTTSAYIGRWRVRVTVDETAGVQVCDDTFQLIAPPVAPGKGPHVTPPPTDTMASTRSTATAPAGWLVVAGVMMVGVAAALSVGVRRST